MKPQWKLVDIVWFWLAISNSCLCANPNKLLIIMMDGFRWDYYEQNKAELKGFRSFLKDGCQAQWVDPGFPSVSYPAWTTISTGLYAESHGILDNYMFDLERGVAFDFGDDSTKNEMWWQDAEPVWITATRNNRKTFLYYWSRCDVPFKGILPHRCTGYEQPGLFGGVESFRKTLNLAIDNLLEPADYQLAMVYSEHLDNVGHQFGPFSKEIKQAMKKIDEVLVDFMTIMADTRLDERVNVIILSDHGMTWTGEGSGTKTVDLGDYLNSDYVDKIVGDKIFKSIAPRSNRINEVYESLKDKRGFDVYRREDIPEEYHYKNHRLIFEILVVARPNYCLENYRSEGSHGFANMASERTIFFARGPDFKKGHVHPPIRLVDEYQIFAKLLQLSPQPNNGTWSNVAGMLIN